MHPFFSHGSNVACCALGEHSVPVGYSFVASVGSSAVTAMAAIQWKWLCNTSSFLYCTLSLMHLAPYERYGSVTYHCMLALRLCVVNRAFNSTAGPAKFAPEKISMTRGAGRSRKHVKPAAVRRYERMA